MGCSELYAIIGFQQTKVSYFGNSVPKIYTTQEDYKPVIIWVHCFQIPIYTESMPVYFMIQYKTTPQN